MLKIINATIVIAVVTFLWYRRSKLWEFYYSIISKSLQQIKTNSLDRNAWEKIAFDNLDLLVKSLLRSLFEFEIQYLRKKITDNQYSLWVCDSSTNGEKVTTITDKEKFCVYSLKKTFFTDFRFCGFYLFINSIRYRSRKKENTGYKEEISETRLK